MKGNFRYTSFKKKMKLLFIRKTLMHDAIYNLSRPALERKCAIL
jgi:hypothetical protein